MKLTKEVLRKIINEEANKLIQEAEERESEMKEFARSKSGSTVTKAGSRIRSAGSSIREVAEDQTGNMRRTLHNISDFVEGLGSSLENINSLDEDLTRLYTMASSVSTLTLKSFNFSTIVANELITSAQIAASKVLDLSIIGGFVKGKVFVAGDDFTSNDFIDTSVGINTSQAEILKGGAAMALKRVGSVQVTSPNNEITITQVAPQNTTSDPNNPHPPTPGNLERFYEGKFYAYIGEIEPEGGFLDIQYIVDPANIITSGSSTTADGQTDDSDAFDAYTSALDAGFYAIMPPTEEAKKIIRHRMLDGQPDTYWQCEYVYETPSLLPGGGGASSPISSASLVE